MEDAMLGPWPHAIGMMFLAAFVLSIGFGIVARRTDFCPLGGIADYLHSRRSGRLAMYFFAIGVTILGVTLLGALGIVDFDSTRPPYRMAQLRWPGFLLGGMLFGVGMTMCRGCGMKNMLNLGSGDAKALIAVFGMGAAAVALLYVDGVFDFLVQSWLGPLTVDLQKSGFDHQDIGTFAAQTLGGDVWLWRAIAGAALGLLLVAMTLRVPDFRARWENIVGGAFVAFFIIGLFYISGGPLGAAAKEAADFMDEPQNGMGIQSYTFIRPMGDLLYVASNPVSTLVTLGLVAFIGVGVGSLLVSLVSGRFAFKWFSSTGEAARFLAGGVLVGVGGIMGMGCTLGQGLAGMSTLAVGSMIDLGSLMLGAVIGIKAQRHFMDDHEVIN